MSHAAHVPRRVFVRLASIAAASYVLPDATRAASLAERAVRSNLTQIQLSLEKAQSLRKTVASLKQPLSADDAQFVLRYAAVWLQPGREAMALVSRQTAVAQRDVGAVDTIAAATLGHLLELQMELQRGDRDRVVAEIDEYIQSAHDLLSLPSMQPFIK
ncbi:unnamed protein product [Agarophyton chilense]